MTTTAPPYVPDYNQLDAPPCAPHHSQLGPDPEAVVPRFDAIMRAARARSVARPQLRPDRSHPRETRRETPGQARERRARACAEAHARTVAAFRELDLVIQRSEHWCERLELQLVDAGARTDDLRVALRRRGYVN